MQIAVVIPHAPALPHPYLGPCIESFARAGADTIVVACGNPLEETGYSSIVQNINRGLRAVADCDYVLIANDDICWRSGDLTRLCRPATVRSPAIIGAPPGQAFQGCCFCVPLAVIEEVGPLDPLFTGYFEDADYAIRLRAAGVALWAEPHVVMEHMGGGANTIRRMDAGAIMQENRMRFEAKWGAEAHDVTIWLAPDTDFQAWQERRRATRNA